MNGHHQTLSPSSFPAILSCSCFFSRSDSNRDAEKGISMHAYLSALVDGRPADITGLEDLQVEACQDIYEQVNAFVKDNCPDSPLESERKMTLTDNLGNIVTFGTADIFTKGKDFVVIVDFKGCFDFEPDTKDYKEQLHVYALAGMRETQTQKALCIEAYIMPRKIKPYWTDYTTCVATVECAIARRNDPYKIPTVNDFCCFCSAILNCPAINKRIGAVTTLFCDMPKPEKILDPSKMTPAEMAVALTFSRTTLKQYIKKLVAVSDWIEEAALKISDDNKEIPGYVRTIESGKKSVLDIDKAFRLSGMQAKDFFGALKISLPQLGKAFAKVSGLKEREARLEIEGRINEVIDVGEGKAILERAGDAGFIDLRG